MKKYLIHVLILSLGLTAVVCASREQSSGVKLNYIDTGLENSPVIVFIHGGTSYSHGWDLVMDELKNEYRLIALDLRGHGESPAPVEGYTAFDFSEDTRGLIKELGLKKIILVGHSIGGMAAIELAANEPVLISKLILINTPVIPARIPAIKELNRFIQSVKYPLPEKFIVMWTTFVKPVPQDFLEAGRKNTRNLSENTWKKTIAGVESADISRFLPKVQQPTLIIWGMKDTLLPIEEMKMLDEKIKNSYVYPIMTAGHNPNCEEPEIVADAIREFISGETGLQSTVSHFSF